MEKDLYSQKYQEIKLLGKGNYGQAYRVRAKKDGKSYVAKKMMLQGLGEPEISASWGEIEILQKFNDMKIPFIVQYTQCFHFESQLIIIMEYCESGDLSNFLKNCKKRESKLSEKIIAYWFIQLLFGVKSLHSKNVLHRDLKSANVFLTSNYTLKIGDFGISKVLDSTSANTCIGTPYYLSPEVCNSQPYGLSSDVWALGCIIYELCALKYPFEGSNIIILAHKIVSEEIKPIPECYSRQLNDIIKQMFHKDRKKRITIDEILNTQYIKKYMMSFINDQGKLKELAEPIQTQQSQKKQEQFQKDNAEDTMKTINSVVEKSGPVDTLNYSLTPKERLRLRKEEQIQKRTAELNQATKESYALKQFVEQTKQRVLGQTMGSKSNVAQQTLKKQYNNDNKCRSQLKFKAKQMEKMQTIDLNLIKNTIKNISMRQSEHEFEEIPLPGESEYIPIHSEKTLKKNQFKSNTSNATFESTIKEEIDQYEELDEYYDDDFEDYDEKDQQETKISIQQQKEQYSNVLAFVQNQVGSSNVSPTKKQNINNIFKNQEIKTISSAKKIALKKEESIKIVGKAKFEQLYLNMKKGKITLKTMNKDSSEFEVMKNIEEILFYESS